MTMRCLTGRPRALRPRLYEELEQALKKDGGPLIVLVPEQYTLESEREIIEALGVEGSFRLQVMSPARLYSRIFEAAGKPAETRIDERGRVMLMHAAIRNLTKELSWYRGSQHRPGFAELAAGQIRELKQAGYSPDKLENLANDLKAGPLKSKLNDLKLLWSAYEEALSGRFMDGEDEVLRALDRIGNVDFLKESRIWAHGFELISPTLALTLTALAEEHGVSLLLPLENDVRARDFQAFEPVGRTLDRLIKMAAGRGVEVERVFLTEPEQDGAADDLAYLRREINCFPPKPFEGRAVHIRLTSRKNPLDEAMMAMAVIRDRVMSGKMRWRDAAIACFDMPGCAGALERAAGLYGVPIFLENSRSADRNALAQFVLLALKIISTGWQREDVCRLMRTGFSALNEDEADLLSNCAVEQGLRGHLWKKPLKRYGDERDAAMEPLRAKLVEPLTAFEEEFSAAENTRAQMRALWNLLTAAGAYEKLSAFRENCAQSGMMEAANENAQVWNRLMTTMDQLCSLMAEVDLGARDVYELLSQSLAASEIRPLPQSGDAVMTGSMSHLRGSGVQMLFILGCNEQRAPESGGLFQTHEREILGGEKDVWLAPDGSDRAKLAAIDLSAALTLAGKFVVFAYAQSDAEGAALLPGSVVSRLKAVFPELCDSGGLNSDALERLMDNAPDAALMRLSARLNAPDDGARGALAALSRIEELSRPLYALKRASGLRAFSADMDRTTARRLYGGPSSVSVTRLEKYAACPFAHFISYGLRPEQLEPYELQKKDEGTFYHEALEDFLKNSGDSLAGLSAEEAVERMDAVADRLLAPMMDGPLSDNPVMLAHSRRMRMIARRAARTVTKHLSESGFQPCALEVKFGEYDPAVVLHTSSGNMPLQGRIDRIDAWTNEDETWLRVIDYKSGRSDMNLSRLYFGLQLQLIIYLAAALAHGEAHPAGAFYFKVDDPLVDSESRDPDVIESERAKELRLSGLYIDDQAVLSAMSPGVDRIVNLTLKSDGTPRSTPSMLDEDGFGLLIRHALEAAAELTNGILAGKTDIDPKKMTGFCSCDRCDWRAVCQQDPLLGGMPRQLVPAVSQRDVLGMIQDRLMEREQTARD